MRDLAPTHQFEGHTREIFSLVKIPGTDMIVSGGMDNSIIFWRQSGQYLFRRKKLPNAVYHLFANTSFVGAVCYDILYLFDLYGCVVSQIGFGKRIMTASFIPSLKLISVGLMDGEFCVVDFNGQPYFYDTLHESALVSITWVRNPRLIEEYGNIFSTVGFDRKIHVFSFLFEETSKRALINKIESIDLKHFGINSVPKKLLFNETANFLILLTFKSEILLFDFMKTNRSIFPTLIPAGYYSPNRDTIGQRNNLFSSIIDAQWYSDTMLGLAYENGSLDILGDFNVMPMNLTNINQRPGCLLIDSERRQIIVGTLSASLIFIDIPEKAENIRFNNPNLNSFVISGNLSTIHVIKFFLNGQIFITLDTKKRYIIWKTDTFHNRLTSIDQFQSLFLVEPDPTRKYGFLQSNGLTIWIFDFQTGENWVFQAEYRNKMVAWNKTSNLLFLTDDSGNCQILKFDKTLPDGLKIVSLFDFRLEQTEYSILAAKWSKKSDILVIFDSKGYIHVYSVESSGNSPTEYSFNRIHHQKAMDGMFEFIDFDPETGYFFLSNKKILFIYQFSRNDIISSHFAHPISAIKVLESEEAVVIGFEDGAIQVLNYRGESLISMKSHDTAISAIDFYEKDHKFVSADESGKICLWNLEDVRLEQYYALVSRYYS